jgi:alpha-mannosidase
VIDEQGREVPAQRLSSGELTFLASDVPSFGSRHYRVVPGKCSINKGCRLNGTTMENENLRISIDPRTGNITELWDLATGHNFALAASEDGLNVFRWLPGDGGNAQPDKNPIISVIESGPLVVELQISSQATGCRGVIRSVRLVAGQRSVELRNVVDKLPLDAKDGVHFGFFFNVSRATTRLDIPWGILRVQESQWPSGNRNWLTMQRWLDISNDHEGVTWCALDAPLVEYGAMTANQTGDWSGERAPWIRKLEPSSTIFSWVMNNHWFTNFPLTQDGPVTFRYRLFVHGAYDAGQANRFGLEQTQPLIHLAANTDPRLQTLLGLTDDLVSVSILKSSTDGKTVIVRLRSLSDQDDNAGLVWPAGRPKCVRLCPVGEEAGDAVSDQIIIPAHGLVTLRLEF